MSLPTNPLVEHGDPFMRRGRKPGEWPYSYKFNVFNYDDQHWTGLKTAYHRVTMSTKFRSVGEPRNYEGAPVDNWNRKPGAWCFVWNGKVRRDQFWARDEYEGFYQAKVKPRSPWTASRPRA